MRSSAVETQEDECNNACGGNSRIKCGGAYRMNLFRNSALLALAAAASSSSLASISSTRSSSSSSRTSNVPSSASALASSSSVAVASSSSLAAAAAGVVNNASSSSGASGGIIAGAVVGSVIGAALIAALLFFFFRRRRNAASSRRGSRVFDAHARPGSGIDGGGAVGGAWTRNVNSSDEGGSTSSGEKTDGEHGNVFVSPDDPEKAVGSEGPHSPKSPYQLAPVAHPSPLLGSNPMMATSSSDSHPRGLGMDDIFVVGHGPTHSPDLSTTDRRSSELSRGTMLGRRPSASSSAHLMQGPFSSPPPPSASARHPSTRSSPNLDGDGGDHYRRPSDQSVTGLPTTRSGSISQARKPVPVLSPGEREDYERSAERNGSEGSLTLIRKMSASGTEVLKDADGFHGGKWEGKMGGEMKRLEVDQPLAQS